MVNLWLGGFGQCTLSSILSRCPRVGRACILGKLKLGWRKRGGIKEVHKKFSNCLRGNEVAPDFP